MTTRWRFCGYGEPDDLAARAERLARIDAWWQAFRARADDISARFSHGTDWDLPAWMAEHLQAVDPNLMWEFGPAINADGHRLVITPEMDHHLRPLTDTILQRAPQIDGWEFYSYRLPEALPLARLTVEGRTGGTLDDVQVRVGRDERHLVDVCFCSPKTISAEDEDAFHVAFVAAEALLGEECVDKWIGAIEVSPLPITGGLKPIGRRPGADMSRLIPLERLRDTVDAVVVSIQDQLPRQPHLAWIDDAQWTVWKLQPDEDADYPDQRDLFVARSASPAMWQAAHTSRLFYSERFSRCGETFCYVKIDGSNGPSEEQLDDKEAIENAIDEALRPGRLGCAIGGGTGLRYSYIDLALVDLAAGIEAVRRTLRQANVSNRCWIQFYDSDLAAEWIGIYDNTPPPPLVPLGR